MKVREFIRGRFQSFGIKLSDFDLISIWDEDTDYTPAVKHKVEVAIVRFIPELLLRPTSISESGFSMSWDAKGIKDYYSLKCKELGLDDKLSSKPKITFL